MHVCSLLCLLPAHVDTSSMLECTMHTMLCRYVRKGLEPLWDAKASATPVSQRKVNPGSIGG